MDKRKEPAPQGWLFFERSFSCFPVSPLAPTP
jgi:hypothetical protein